MTIKLKDAKEVMTIVKSDLFAKWSACLCRGWGWSWVALKIDNENCILVNHTLLGRTGKIIPCERVEMPNPWTIIFRDPTSGHVLFSLTNIVQKEKRPWAIQEAERRRFRHEQDCRRVDRRNRERVARELIEQFRSKRVTYVQTEGLSRLTLNFDDGSTLKFSAWSNSDQAVSGRILIDGKDIAGTKWGNKVHDPSVG